MIILKKTITFKIPKKTVIITTTLIKLNQVSFLTDNPKITACKVVAQSRLFRIEQLELQFNNGVEVVYECLKGSSNGWRVGGCLANR